MFYTHKWRVLWKLFSSETPSAQITSGELITDPTVFILLSHLKAPVWIEIGAPSCFTVTQGYVILGPGAHTKLSLFSLSSQTQACQLLHCHLFGPGWAIYIPCLLQLGSPSSHFICQLILWGNQPTLFNNGGQDFGRREVAQPLVFQEK